MAISSESMAQVSLQERIAAMTDATGECDWDHNLTVSGVFDNDPEELAFCLKPPCAEMPANA